MSILARNCVNIIGQGKKIVMFAHGYGCGQNMWRFIVPYFMHDYKIILFDHIGNGNSDVSTYDSVKYNTLAAYADDVIAICDELKVSDIIFVGHSVSASIGALACNKRPDLFSDLIMIGPSPKYINEGSYSGGFNKEDIEGLLNMMEYNYVGWSAALSSMVIGHNEKPELIEELTESFCSMQPEIAMQFATVTFFSDNREDYKKIKTKTLILQCSNDAIASTEVGMFTHKVIKHSEFITLQAKGHCPHLSAPSETAESIIGYLKRKVSAKQTIL